MQRRIPESDAERRATIAAAMTRCWVDHLRCRGGEYLRAASTFAAIAVAGRTRALTIADVKETSVAGVDAGVGRHRPLSGVWTRLPGI